MPTSGVPESVPLKAYQCLSWGVIRSRPIRFGWQLIHEIETIKNMRSFF
jgi:hypothetical protein